MGRTVRANGWSSEKKFREDHRKRVPDRTELEEVILDVEVAVTAL